MTSKYIVLAGVLLATWFLVPAGSQIVLSPPAGGGSGAPTTATYITQTANGSLSNEQALGLLATGLMFSTTTTGAVTTLAPTDDSIVVGNGTAYQIKAFTDCTGAGKAITYAVSTNTLGCNTIPALGAEGASAVLTLSADEADDANDSYTLTAADAAGGLTLGNNSEDIKFAFTANTLTLSSSTEVDALILAAASGTYRIGTADAVSPNSLNIWVGSASGSNAGGALSLKAGTSVSGAGGLATFAAGATLAGDAGNTRLQLHPPSDLDGGGAGLNASSGWFVLDAGNSSGTNIAGQQSEIYGAQGTGNAAGGPILFFMTAPGVSGDGFNSAAEVARFDYLGLTVNNILTSLIELKFDVMTALESSSQIQSATDGTLNIHSQGTGVVMFTGNLTRMSTPLLLGDDPHATVGALRFGSVYATMRNTADTDDLEILMRNGDQFIVGGNGSLHLKGTPDISFDTYLRSEVVLEAAPAAVDCDNVAETNRFVFDSTNNILWFCSGASGWRQIATAAP